MHSETLMGADAANWLQSQVLHAQSCMQSRQQPGKDALAPSAAHQLGLCRRQFQLKKKAKKEEEDKTATTSELAVG
jgi:hypothetical protein